MLKNLTGQNKEIFRPIAFLEKQCIDSKKEFNVSVEAALFYCRFNSGPAYDCRESNFYNDQAYYLQFGWVADKFVSNITRSDLTKLNLQFTL